MLLLACLLACAVNVFFTLRHAYVQVTGVDKSVGTLMASLGLMQAVATKGGPEMAAARVLPIMAPMLTAKSLSY